MTAEEARFETFTAHEALRIVREHNLSWEDFTAEVGNRREYAGSDILDWLGY